MPKMCAQLPKFNGINLTLCTTVCGIVTDPRQTPVTEIDRADHVPRETMSSVGMILPFTSPSVDNACVPRPLPLSLTQAGSRARYPSPFPGAYDEASVGIRHTRASDNEYYWDEILKYTNTDLPRKRRRRKVAQQRRIAAPSLFTGATTACCKKIRARGVGWDSEGADDMWGLETLDTACLRQSSLKAIQITRLDDHWTGSDNSEDLDSRSFLPCSEDFHSWVEQVDRSRRQGHGITCGYGQPQESLCEHDKHPILGYTESTRDRLKFGLQPIAFPATETAAVHHTGPRSYWALNLHQPDPSLNGSAVMSAPRNRDGQVGYGTPNQDAMRSTPLAFERSMETLHDHLGTRVYMVDEFLENGYIYYIDRRGVDNHNDMQNGYFYLQQDADDLPDGHSSNSQQQQQHYQPTQASSTPNQHQPHHHENHAMGQESSTARMDRTPPALPATAHPNEPIAHQIRRVQSAYMATLQRQWQDQQLRARLQRQEQEQEQEQQGRHLHPLQRDPFPGSVGMSRHRTVPLQQQHQPFIDGPMPGGTAMSRTTFQPMEQDGSSSSGLGPVPMTRGMGHVDIDGIGSIDDERAMLRRNWGIPRSRSGGQSSGSSPSTPSSPGLPYPSWTRADSSSSATTSDSSGGDSNLQDGHHDEGPVRQGGRRWRRRGDDEDIVGR